jgi:hypothetical protein
MSPTFSWDCPNDSIKPFVNSKGYPCLELVVEAVAGLVGSVEVGVHLVL